MVNELRTSESSIYVGLSCLFTQLLAQSGTLSLATALWSASQVATYPASNFKNHNLQEVLWLSVLNRLFPVSDTVFAFLPNI